jgi:transposase
MTYSTDFRCKVLTIKEQENLSYEETAQRFKIGIASLTRWNAKLEPQLTRNKPATKIDMEVLAKDVETYPDAYQYERAKRLGVSQRGIGLALKRLKISYKKNAVTSKGQRRRTATLSNTIENA